MTLFKPGQLSAKQAVSIVAACVFAVILAVFGLLYSFVFTISAAWHAGGIHS